MTEIILVLALLQLKHLLVDWCWQPMYELSNKGTYGHWGGIRHALKNAVGTATCFAIAISNLGVELLLLITIVDFAVHYHVDWAKMNINTATGWTPNHPQFWWLTGADQFAHQLTYVFLVATVVTV